MGAVLLSPLYILLNLYLISRMLLWFGTLHSFLGTLWFVVPFLICYVLIALSPLAAAFGRGKFKQVSRVISNYWIGTLMYMLIFLLLFDLGRILLRLSRKRSLFDPIDIDSYRISGGIIFFGVILLSVYGILHAGKIKKKHYDVKLSRRFRIHPDVALTLPASQNQSGSSTCDPATGHRSQSSHTSVTSPAASAPSLRIALVADLHLGGNVGLPHARKMKKIIDRMHPDLIIYAGDIFDNDFDAIDKPDEIAAVFRSLSSTYGSYACWGNHDIDEVILAGFTFNSGSAATASDPRMDRFLIDANIRLLKDETVLIGDAFYLIGRLDASCRQKSGIIRKTAAELIQPLDASHPVLVIDHQPSELSELAAAGADLVLSGHTHDGQLFPGNITTRIGWKNSCGKLVLGDMTSIVTSGVGVWGPAMRIGTDSEVVEVDVTFLS